MVNNPTKLIKTTAYVWANKFGITIMDPDGWRRDNKDMGTCIDVKEFVDRMEYSTIQTNDMVKFNKMYWAVKNIFEN